MKLKNDDEAVSPVIGVILMVAITVVLAAVVFVLVSDLGPNAEQAPKIGFIQDGDTWIVSSVDVDVLWSDLKVTGCTGYPSSTDATVGPGDQITGCSGTWTLSHTPTKTLIYTDSA